MSGERKEERGRKEETRRERENEHASLLGTDRAFSRNRAFLASVRIPAREHVRARNDAYLVPR